MFRSRGIAFRKMVVYKGMVYYVLHTEITIKGFYEVSKYKTLKIKHILYLDILSKTFIVITGRKTYLK